MSHFQFEHSVYDINILECYVDYLKRVSSDDSFVPKINTDEYLKRVRFEVVNYARLKGFEANWTEIAKKQVFFIDQEHNLFCGWLLRKLSLLEIYEIPLVLDHFLKNSEKTKSQFVNGIEFDVLKYFEHQVFHDTTNTKITISNWIRETRKSSDFEEQDEEEDDTDGFKNRERHALDYNMENVPFIEEYIDTFVQSKATLKTVSQHSTDTSFDDRIKTKLAPDKIMTYFDQLTKEIKPNQSPLSKEDVDVLVRSNFQNFTPTPRKLLSPNIGKGILMKFIYNFYYLVDGETYGGKQLEYCKFLVNNFEQFSNDRPEDISKKLATSKPKRYPFEI